MRKQLRTHCNILTHLLDTNAKNAHLVFICEALHMPPQWQESLNQKIPQQAQTYTTYTRTRAHTYTHAHIHGEEGKKKDTTKPYNEMYGTSCQPFPPKHPVHF